MQLYRFSARATNLTLLALLMAAAVTGLASFLVGSPSHRWVFWLHSVGGLTLALVLLWKRRIVLGSLRRHGVGLWALPSLLLLGLLFGALVTGILWSTSGLPGLAGISGLTIHVALSAALALLVLPHARAGWPQTRYRALRSRRGFLRTGLLLAAGLVLWRGTEAASAVAGFSGSRRRFTGSREASSLGGNDFPSNSWLLDDPAPIDGTTWRLAVHGAVRTPLQLSTSDLNPSVTWMATIDCTGGWYSMQAWQGMPVSALLARVEAGPGARSIVVRSSTGYWRRFPLTAAPKLLLATVVGDELLAHEHGAPLRLVAPGRRGYDWVKWVSAVEISRLPPWWNWPLPLS